MLQPDASSPPEVTQRSNEVKQRSEVTGEDRRGCSEAQKAPPDVAKGPDIQQCNVVTGVTRLMS